MKVSFFIAITALTLSGCTSTPTGNIEAFGVAASGVTEKIDAVISDYNTANINDKLVTMANFSKKYTKSDFDPIKKVIIRDADKKDFALYKANKALGGYAKSLSALAKAGSREELAMAGVKLSTSLKGINEQYQILADTDKNLITDENSSLVSRVISEIATYYVENKRGEALKKIILAADESVQTIGTVINEQLLKGVIEGRLYTMRSNELAGYLSDYNAKSSKSTFANKKKELDKIYQKYIVMESSTATVIQAQKAIYSVMKAHKKLKTELENDRFDSKELFKVISDIKTVHKSFDDLQELMMDCTTEIIADDAKGIICKEAT